MQQRGVNLNPVRRIRMKRQGKWNIYTSRVWKPKFCCNQRCDYWTNPPSLKCHFKYYLVDCMFGALVWNWTLYKRSVSLSDSAVVHSSRTPVTRHTSNWPQLWILMRTSQDYKYIMNKRPFHICTNY